MARPVLLLAALALSPLASAIGPHAEWTGVLVAPAGPEDALVSWTADAPAAEYRVYGDGELLDVTSELNSVVPAGFREYQVATVVDGEVLRIRKAPGYCVDVLLTTPPQVLIYRCNGLAKTWLP